MRVKIRILFLAVAVAYGAAVGDAPFWYQDAVPPTNRVAASVMTALAETEMELRCISIEESNAETFTTYPRGLAMFIR